VQNPYLTSSQPIRFWANKYKTKSMIPYLFSVYAYNIIDTFAKAAQKAVRT